ncbi:MFS transporter [Fictibacillus sp. FJAT-27399]|uniref:MFS transporter n=1 Tax=Fictibacillus sp. FJAT-27399 TaxID=1729689 RepID=UPI0009E9E985|nr:MFS transporter [Fictibacillus sp. FJAT-27399]
MQERSLYPLWLVSFSQLLTMLIWFNYSAILPSVKEEWGLTSGNAGIILSSFQCGYLVSVLILGHLSDRYNPRIIFILSAIVSGIGGVMFGLFANGFWSGLLYRFIAGIGLGGIYVPGLKYLSGLYPPHTRGKIFGIYVGALVVGSGGSLLISSPLISFFGWRIVVIITSIGAFLAAAMMLRYRVDPPISPPTSVTSLKWKSFKPIFLNKKLVRMNLAYAGHMWELYAFWGWVGPFMVYVSLSRGYDIIQAQQLGNFWAGIFVVIGAIGTWLGGQISDIKGRIPALKPLLFIGLFCSLGFGWLSSSLLPITILIGIIYGITVVGDSPIYSVAISELSATNSVGLALGIQQVLGYSVTIISPSIFGYILNISPNEKVGWGLAFSILALGPLLSLLVLRKNVQRKSIQKKLFEI